MKFIRFITTTALVFFMISCSNIDMENITREYLENVDLQGHRGARGLKPENTIPSFLEALKYNVTTLELDLVVSKDNQLVVSHEAWFNHKICSNPDGSPIAKSEAKERSIYQMDYAEIKQYDCGRRGNPDFKEQVAQEAFKPTLAMVVQAVNQYLVENDLPPVRYNIEMKSSPEEDGEFNPTPERFARLVYGELKRLGLLDKSTVQSFDFRTLRAIHAIDDSLVTAALVYHPLSKFEKDIKNVGYTPTIYSCHFNLVSEKLVEKAHKAGVKVIPWTVNDVNDMKAMLSYGVDGLITDYPDRARKLIDELAENLF